MPEARRERPREGDRGENPGDDRPDLHRFERHAPFGPGEKGGRIRLVLDGERAGGGDALAEVDPRREIFHGDLALAYGTEINGLAGRLQERRETLLTKTRLRAIEPLEQGRRTEDVEVVCVRMIRGGEALPVRR